MSKTLITQAVKDLAAAVGIRIVGQGYLCRGDGTGTLVADQNSRLAFYWKPSPNGVRVVGMAVLHPQSSIVFQNNVDYENIQVDIGYTQQDDKLYILSQSSFDISGGGTTVVERAIAAAAATTNLPLSIVANNTQPSLTIFVRQWYPVVNGIAYWFPNTAVDLTSYLPGSANEMCYAVIFVQNDYSTIEVQTSTPRSTSGLPLGLADEQEAIDAASAGDVQIFAVKLVNGQTAITQDDLNNNGVPLQPYVWVDTGGSGSGGPALSFGGNTTGTLALISSGTALFAGGNNITLSQNGQSVTISAFNQSVQTQSLIRDVSISGNTSGTLVGITSGTLYLAGGNNITLSQNGQSITVSGANTVAQSVQTQNLVDVSLSGNTSGTLALVSSGTFILAGGNNITLSQNGQSVTVSAANQSVQTQNIHDLSLSGNTSGTLALISSGTAILAGGNNITLSQNGQSVTISAFNQSAQTGSIIREISLSGNTSGTLTDITSGTAYFAGGNNITLSQNGQSVTISAFNQSQQTQNIIREISLSGNTSGTLTDITSGTAYFAGGNNITLSQQSNSITISGANQTVQTQHVHDVTLAGNTSGTLTIVSSGTLTLAGGNNITLSQSGNAVTISGASQSVQTQNLIDLSLAGNTSGTLALISSGTAILAGGNNITLSQNGQSVTISGAAIVTLSSYEPYPMLNTGTAARGIVGATSGAMVIYPFNVIAPVAARHVNMLVSMSTINALASFTDTLNWGIYSRGLGANNTTLSLFTSSSLSFAMQASGAGFATLLITFPVSTNDTGYSYEHDIDNGNSAQLSNFNGLKLFQLLLLTTLTQGDYWLGLIERVSSSGTNNTWGFSYIGNANTLTALSPIGGQSNQYSTGSGAQFGQWPALNLSFTSAGLSALPATVDFSHLTAGNAIIPYMSFQTTA